MRGSAAQPGHLGRRANDSTTASVAMYAGDFEIAEYPCESFQTLRRPLVDLVQCRVTAGPLGSAWRPSRPVIGKAGDNVGDALGSPFADTTCRVHRPLEFESHVPEGLGGRHHARRARNPIFACESRREARSSKSLPRVFEAHYSIEVRRCAQRRLVDLRGFVADEAIRIAVVLVAKQPDGCNWSQSDGSLLSDQAEQSRPQR